VPPFKTLFLVSNNSRFWKFRCIEISGRRLCLTERNEKSLGALQLRRWQTLAAGAARLAEEIAMALDIYGNRSSGWALSTLVPLAVLAAAGMCYFMFARLNRDETAEEVGVRTGRKQIRTEEPMAGYGR
jgi:hypothetical protein